MLGGLNTATIANLILAVPSRGEQTVLLGEVRQCQASLDGLIRRIRDAIDGLKELRTVLISAAVTGKIDVRGEAV